MSELLKRADNFNSLSDGTSGKNPADAKLVADLAERVRELQHKSYAKRVAVGFFQFWWNTSGTNTNQGFDTYWEKLRVNELELPNKYAVEDVTEEDVHETKFPPVLEPFDLSNGDPNYQITRDIDVMNVILKNNQSRIEIDRGRDADRRYHRLRKGNEGRKPRIKIITPEEER